MFCGATTINLDNKGRLAIPTRYRDVLSAGLVCTVDIYQPCLLLYPIEQWEVIEQKLAALSSINPAERRIQRLLLGHASECQMDSQGRILLSSTLRQYAGLEKSIMFVGQLNKFELWQQETWQQQIAEDIAQAPQDMPQLAEKLPNLTL